MLPDELSGSKKVLSKIAEMSLEFRDFVKISPNFDDYLETLEGACTGAQKSRKSKIGENELKHI